MAHQQVSMGLAMILTTLLWAGVATAQSSSCTNVLISLSPCLNYISGNSSTPSSVCCSQLRTVVGSQPQCLCQVLNGGGSNLGLNINQTQAIALPGACNVQTPPLSQCNAAASPADSPSSEPADSPSSEPADSPNTNSGEGSKTVPTGDGSSSDATSNKLGVAMLFCLLFVASYVTTSNMA